MTSAGLRITNARDLGRRMAERKHLEIEPQIVERFLDTVRGMEGVVARDVRRLAYTKHDIFRALLNGVANAKTKIEAAGLAKLCDNLVRLRAGVGDDFYLPLDPASCPEQKSPVERVKDFKRLEKFRKKFDDEMPYIRERAQAAYALNQFIWPIYRRLWLRFRSQGIYGVRAVGTQAHIDAATIILGVEWTRDPQSSYPKAP